MLFWAVVVPLMLAGAAVGPLVLSDEWTAARVLVAAGWVAIWALFSAVLYSSVRHPRVPARGTRAHHSVAAARWHLRAAQITHGLAALMLLPPILGERLWTRGVYWRPLSILVFASGIALLPLHALFQILSSISTRALHGHVGTSMVISDAGIELTREDQPARSLRWSEVTAMQVKVGRHVAEFDFSIRDVRIYELLLHSGETLLVDFVDEDALLAACRERHIELREPPRAGLARPAGRSR